MDTNLGRTFRRLRKFKNMEIKEWLAKIFLMLKFPNLKEGKRT